MNKAVAAGIGVAIVLIAISALYMMNQSDEPTSQVELSEEVEMAAEESKTESYEVVIDEGVKVGDKPPVKSNFTVIAIQRHSRTGPDYH